MGRESNLVEVMNFFFLDNDVGSPTEEAMRAEGSTGGAEVGERLVEAAGTLSEPKETDFPMCAKRHCSAVYLHPPDAKKRHSCLGLVEVRGILLGVVASSPATTWEKRQRSP